MKWSEIRIVADPVLEEPLNALLLEIGISGASFERKEKEIIIAYDKIQA